MPRLGTSLAFGRLVALKSAEVVLAFPKDAAFHRGTVTGTGKNALEGALGELFGRRMQVSVDDNALPPATASPAEREAQRREERRKSLEEKIRQHPSVQASLRILGGQIEQVQVMEAERRVPAADSPAPAPGATANDRGG